MRYVWIILCCVLTVAALTVNCTPAGDITPPLANPEVISNVTGVKVLPDGNFITLLVLYQPDLNSNIQRTLTIDNMRNSELSYVADVPAEVGAQVRVFNSSHCLPDGYCSGSRAEVHLHSFSELH